MAGSSTSRWNRQSQQQDGELYNVNLEEEGENDRIRQAYGQGHGGGGHTHNNNSTSGTGGGIGAWSSSAGGSGSLRRSVSSGLRNLGERSGRMLQQMAMGTSTVMPGIFGGERSMSTSAAAARRHDDEEALHWAAIEKLPTYDRVRTAFLRKITEDGAVIQEEVDVTKLGLLDRQNLIDKILKVATEDNDRLLRKLRDRIDKVGIDLPKIEVRFEHLNVDANVYVASRAVPTLFNFTLNTIQDILTTLRLIPSKKRKLSILRDINGIIKPSRMTLLLGPPSSGRTTLLLALAGKLDSALKVSGKITYNGHELHEFVPRRTSAYISQHDVQVGTMTVRETLDFSAQCQGVGTKYDMLVELSRREKAAGIKPDPDIDAFMKATSVGGEESTLATDYVLKILGLDICADTIVGDEMRRGISGGQRKRVTTGEMLVGPCRALFMDEISTGLDSSTTFQIVKCLKQTVEVMDGTMLVALLQPTPETYEIFDDIILLSEGQIVYQGPRAFVTDFFEQMGFKCPERKNVADFLQEVTSRKDQEQYWARRQEEPYRYIPVSEFAQAFQSYHVGQKLASELSTPYDRSRSHPAALATQTYGLPQKELLKACFAREVLLFKRNAFVHVFTAVQHANVALIAMTVFFRTRMHHDTVEDGYEYAGSLFFATVFAMFSGYAEMAMTIGRLPVFYKQRDMLLFPAWAYALPTTLITIPSSILQTIVYVGLTYYVIGYAPEPDRFFRQFLCIFLIHQMAYSLFRLVASICRVMVISNTFGTFCVIVVFIGSGFVISRHDIRPWWIWAYWSSPLMYGLNALSNNEFRSDRWDKPLNANSTVTVGEQVLSSRGFFIEKSWYWIGIGALVGFILLFNILYTVALTYLKPIGKAQAIASDPEEESAEMKKKKQKAANENVATGGGGGGWPAPSFLSQSKRSSRRVSKREGHVDFPTELSTMSSGADSGRFGSTNGGNAKTSRGMILPFQPLSLTFDSISYYVDMPAEMKARGVEEERLRLLNDVSGAFKPGVLTALVGVSGAGKTTLMDVLAGRKTGGYIEGDISISGYPKRQETFTRISGYCEQNDIHSPNVTVYESLVYSAWLRLPADIDKQTRLQFVNEVMELVELTPIKSALVGLPGVSGLSTEQRKRLTIAVELVANPSIIFMDEPTSGLDARAAAIVMRTVRNTVDTGRTVVCTIHQPSIDIFEAFDDLLLLKRGGQVIYSGPLGRRSHRLIEYFESIPGVPKITEGYNPATWMLEVSSYDVETRLNVDFAEIFSNSAVYQGTKGLIKELSVPAPGTEEINFPTRYAQSMSTQFAACLWKQHKSYWRNPFYNAVKLFFTIVIAFLFGTLYWKHGQKRSSIQDLSNILGGMYAATLFLGVTNAASVQPVVGVERTVFYREKAAGMYSPLAYAIAQVVIEIPYTIAQTILYAIMVYSMMDFTWTASKFLWFTYFMFCSFLLFTYYGMMCVSMTPSHHVSAIVSSAFYSLWNLFSGFVVTRPRIPPWWIWYYWCTPVAWTLYGLITSQMGEDETMMVDNESTVKEYIRSYYGFKHSFLGVVGVMNAVFVVLFAFVFAFCIKFLNFQRR